MILGQDVSVYSRLLEQAADDLAKRRFRDALPITVTRSKHKGGRKTWDSENLEGTPYEVMSWGVGIVEVAISTRTLEIHPNRIWLFIDGGTLLTPDFARSSAESAVEQALNRCIGRSRNIDLPLVDIQFHDTGTRRGSKDVSSIPWLLLPAAVVQAVRQASGVNVDTIPITPERLMRAGS
jgi:CO/xanthine dehydrogenase Mo-binding subunit